MNTKGQYWLYGAMMTASAVVLFIMSGALLYGCYLEGEILPLAAVGVAASVIGGFVRGGIEWWRHLRGKQDENLKQTSPWVYGFLLGVEFMILLVAVIAVIEGRASGPSFGAWVSSVGFVLGGATLLMGLVEKWRRTQSLEENNYGN